MASIVAHDTSEAATNLRMSSVFALSDNHRGSIVRLSLHSTARLRFLLGFIRAGRHGGRYYRSIEREASEIGNAPLELLYKTVSAWQRGGDIVEQSCLPCGGQASPPMHHCARQIVSMGQDKERRDERGRLTGLIR